ncbi:MAG TPA: hypothetical protein VF800_21065 [Telluria sp.]|jgi:hypothetical protein
MNDFNFDGMYRVQSRREYGPSVLEGNWYRAPGLIDQATINHALQAHPSWRGTAEVRLRPALITRRGGKFQSEPDILYKRELFEPSAASEPMADDMVDILKAKRNWSARSRHVVAILPDDCTDMVARLRDLELTIANEYVVHEAGHFLSYDVLSKQRDGYFTVKGKTAWPLIYLEELRADLNAFGFAAQLLPAESAAQIFFYNLMLRFGVHREGLLRKKIAPYGLVPYLLFHVLHAMDFVRVGKRGGQHYLQLASTRPADVLEVMRACAAHAEDQLNPGVHTASVLDNAISSAAYIHQRLRDAERVDGFDKVMNKACDQE